MPPKAKSFKAFLKKGCSRPDAKGIVNEKQERRPIAPGTENNYKRGLGTWRAYQRLHLGAMLNNFQTPKDFTRTVAHAIDGRYNDEKACLKTVRQYWNNTTAALDREGEKVKPEIINSTTDGIMLNVFTSARVGEYNESTARQGSGRGLLYSWNLERRRSW
ncbi:hypothetical protein FRB90_000781 [Tulasnella sp. 427]|nr:hypothetical protein FRB90_000781 [Tulasnella sp. 427]